MGEQKTIVENGPERMGIKCYVRCTSNKIDTAKDNVRSVNLNFDIRVGDQLVGKGNNLNINNITPDGYAAMCQAFGVDDIDENTPFFAELMTLMTQELRQDWVTAMAKKDKKVDKDQTDVTRDPDLLTEKQEELIKDWAEKDEDCRSELEDYLGELDLESSGKLDKTQASEVITKMKKIMDDKAQEQESKPAKKSKKK